MYKHFECRFIAKFYQAVFFYTLVNAVSMKLVFVEPIWQYDTMHIEHFGIKTY